MSGIDLLEHIYQQLHGADLIGSKAEFSKRLLAKSRSYLTSMRARQRHVSNDTIMALSDRLRAEIRARSQDRDVADRIVLRRALVEIDDFLGDYPLLAVLAGHRKISRPNTCESRAFSYPKRPTDQLGFRPSPCPQRLGLFAGLWFKQQLRDMRPECISNLIQNADRWVFHLAFEPTDIRAVNACLIGQTFLRDIFCDPQAAHIPGDEITTIHERISIIGR